MSFSLSKRPRGGQPGNRNAIKHGYYSQAFKKVDLENGESIPIFDLKEEIVVLRLYIRRVVAMANESESFVECVGLLRVLSMAYTSLSRLISTQYVVCRPGEEFGEEVDAAIEELFGDRPSLKEFRQKRNPGADPQVEPAGPPLSPDDPGI